MTKTPDSIERELTEAIVKAVYPAATHVSLYDAWVRRTEDGDAVSIDPTIEDVLRAIEKTRAAGELYAVLSSGIFIERELKTITPRVLDGRMLSTGAGWHLGNSLSEQSEKTKRFLHSLLVHE